MMDVLGYFISLIMVNRDPRYHLILSMYEKERIKTFNDIIVYVPKTIIAVDLGMKVTTFNKFLNKTELFSMKQMLLIGSWCELEAKVILKLWNDQYFLQIRMLPEIPSLENKNNQ